MINLGKKKYQFNLQPFHAKPSIYAYYDFDQILTFYIIYVLYVWQSIIFHFMKGHVLFIYKYYYFNKLYRMFMDES